MSGTEIAGAILGLFNIVLLVRRSVWNYPFGIAMVMLYAVVFYQARLYSDAGLQIFFLLVQLYGWWNWVHAKSGDGGVRVGWMTARQRLIWGAVTAALALVDGWLLARYTPDVAPWMDAATTAMSVVGQYLLSIRRIENWLLWIAVDVISVGLYFWKGLLPTTGLYLVFLVLSVIGLMQWRKEWQVRA